MEKVFIVEDDECTLKLYELILERYGYKIIGIAIIFSFFSIF
ncbi:MAG: hypothetical protein ACFE91_07655 [Promethearchaeota archaeon]